MKAIILAAWEWTRLRPLTLETPKAMVEVFGKPLLAHNMDKLIAYVEEFIIVVKYKEDTIKLYFWDSYKWIPIRYHTQWEKKWTAGALEWIDIDWDCFVLASDTIFQQDDIDMLASHPGYWVLAKKVENPEKYGIFQTNSDNKLQKVIEKPQDYIWNLASLFYFKVNHSLISDTESIQISARWEYELTDALNIFCAKEQVSVLEITHNYIDITSLEDLNKVHTYKNIQFWEIRYIENVWDNELHLGISETHIDDIIKYTRDSEDEALQKNTWDSKRFSSSETMQKWYSDSGRRVYTLIGPDNELLGICYYRPSLTPNILEVVNTCKSDNLKNAKHTSTWGIRLYPIARGKGLAKDFLQVSERVYRSEFSDTLICVDIEEDNIPSRKTFEKCGYSFIWYWENKKSVVNVVHRRCIYVK